MNKTCNPLVRLFVLAVSVLAVSQPIPGLAAELAGLGSAHLRLLTPLSSITSTTGSEIQAVVIAPFERDGGVIMPLGTVVSGKITKRNSVGLGIIHERASLAIRFDSYQLPDGRTYPFQARLRQVENGREYVTETGEMKGVLAADSPQSVLGGIWTRPTWTLFQRAAVGLTGVSGRIWKSYELGFLGGVGLFAIRCVLFRMPEPDIQLPIGSELRILVTSVAEDAPEFAIRNPVQVPADLDELLKSRPYLVSKPNGRPVKDIINMAFEGSQDELLNAFKSSGWIEAAPFTFQAVSLEYHAFTAKQGYSNAPTSTLLYQDAEPRFVFEKALNSLHMRHHIRLWSLKAGGREIWLGAATHDIGFGFDPRAMKFNHRIQPRIDWERTKVLNDLIFSGCAEQAGFVERPDAARFNLNDSGIETDGRLAVLQLRKCAAIQTVPALDRVTPVGPWTARLTRRLVLEMRQYVERESSFFWGYRAIKWSRAAHRVSVVEEEY